MTTSSESEVLQPRPKAFDNVEHVVVLMLENGSFDNLLGWLYDGDHPPRGQAFEGLHSSLWNPLSNIDSDGNRFTERVGVRTNGEGQVNDLHRDCAEILAKRVSADHPSDEQIHDFIHDAYRKLYM